MAEEAERVQGRLWRRPEQELSGWEEGPEQRLTGFGGGVWGLAPVSGQESACGKMLSSGRATAGRPVAKTVPIQGARFNPLSGNY